jgi:hypothetical protein
LPAVASAPAQFGHSRLELTGQHRHHRIVAHVIVIVEPDLTKALLAELGRADTATLAKLSAHVPWLCTAPPGL